MPKQRRTEWLPASAAYGVWQEIAMDALWQEITMAEG
jgi:hypothetical protein